MKFIGIDIGTTSICGVVMDAGNNRIESITRDNSSWISSKHDWERIQDPAKVMKTVRRVLADLLVLHPSIDGIGVTGQMHGIVYTGKDGQAVGPLYTWQDSRGSEKYCGGKTHAAEMSKITGYAVSPGFGMVTHWYNLRHGLVPDATRKFCTIHDYVVMQLCRRSEPVIDPTDAASLGVFDLKKGVFAVKALARVGIESRTLPDIVASGTRAGDYHGIPVYAALGDNQASFLGSVRHVDSSLLLNIGTGGQVSAYTARYARIDGLDTRPFPGGGYLLVGALLCGGKAYALLENFFRKTADFFGLPSRDLDFYQRMGTIDYLKHAGQLRVDTRFSGTRQNSSIRGAIAGVSMDNFTPGHLIAGFLEGITEELSNFHARMPAPVRRDVRYLVGSGNGLRRNELLRKIINRRFGLKIRLPAHCEEASVGAALTAAVGSGYCRDFMSAGRMI